MSAYLTYLKTWKRANAAQANELDVDVEMAAAVDFLCLHLPNKVYAEQKETKEQEVKETQNDKTSTSKKRK